MTYFTDGLPLARTRSLDEFDTSRGESMGAAFRQALFENPASAIGRMLEFEKASDGERTNMGGIGFGAELSRMSRGEGPSPYRQEPETPLLTADDARARVKESGLSLTVPEEGIREGALQILIDRKRGETERQSIISRAPSGSAPLNILAGFAASALDPINIASAFIPVVGEARYARMLENAIGTAGRFGVRARVGALEGAVGAAIVEPLVLAASAQDQSDYDMTDSLLNVAFGTVLGGGLHSFGGAAADALIARAARRNAGLPDAIDSPAVEPVRAAREPDSPESAMDLMRRQMETDIVRTAEASAQKQVLNDLADELSPIASIKTEKVADLKAEQAELARRMEGIDDTFQARAKELQSGRRTRKQAEKAARESIARDKEQMQARAAEVEAQLEANRTQERARQDLSEVRKGRVPERYRDRVTQKSDAIRRGAQRNPIAQGMASARDRVAAAPFAIKKAALQAAVAQGMRGQPVDVEDIFRLQDDPVGAIESIKGKVRQFDREAEATSLRADEVTASYKDDLTELQKAVEEDEQLVAELSRQIDVMPDLAESNLLAANADTYSRAWRAYAVCSMRA